MEHSNTTSIVRTGLDVFINDSSRKNKKYGLVSNPSAILSDGRSACRAFFDIGLDLKVLFGPEHGFLSMAQDAVQCGDSTYHGIPVYSLYGERKSPDRQSMEGIDALVFDIQEIGCRYYTYIYTLAYVMESCQKFDVPLIVLDRPNPIGGLAVEGSPIKKEHSSFVGNYGLCPRHGMTIGEVANYFAKEYFPGLELEVVKMIAWKRSYLWRETGLPWHLPSPNLPNFDCAIVYPGTCLFEGTWMSEGRGTSRPFEIIGAPWVDGEKYREELSSLNLPGAIFSSLSFCPTNSKHKDDSCEGVLLNCSDPYAFNALHTGITMIHTVHRLWPNDFKWRENWEQKAPPFFDNLAGGPELRQMISSDAPLKECLEFADSTQSQFLAKREKYLLY